MFVKSLYFHELNVPESNIITFDNGIIGSPLLTQFALVTSEKNSKIGFLVSTQNENVAFPVTMPNVVTPNYNPQIANEVYDIIMKGGPADDLLGLIPISRESVDSPMKANLKAPILINTKTMKAIQVIIEDSHYPIAYEFTI